MPELPEAESIRVALAELAVGATVASVACRRREVTRLHGRSASRCLLAGAALASIHRHGKQLAIVGAGRRGESGAIRIRLGMSGQLLLAEGRPRFAAHEHVRWNLVFPDGRHRQLRFIDPRRFGGIETFPDLESLRRACWSGLGPDAASIDAATLHAACLRSRRPIKSLLLDQAVLAGVGNIYADESLHRAGIHPETPAAALDPSLAAALAEAVRAVLAAAILAGGSTLRDHRHPLGDLGAFQHAHRVYGRSGSPCPACGTPIERITLSGRGTHFCPACQPIRQT
jgi:formamidopyrimidine-DNA glycosylase